MINIDNCLLCGGLGPNIYCSICEEYYHTFCLGVDGNDIYIR